MQHLLIAIAAALAIPAAQADVAYPKGCFSPPICVTTTRTGSTLDFNYESLTDQPFTVALSVTLGGINHSIHFKTTELPRTQKLFSYQLPARGNWHYDDWRFAFHPGVQTAQHDPATVYALPFKSGRWVWVVQAYDDSRSHTGSSRFAIDFGVPIGTEVFAARGGVVIGTEATSNESSRDGVRMARPNYVWVRHSDGTVGYYVHLRHGGVAVAVGQAVKTGQLLGYSGCTGQCGGPHLHFHVSTSLQASDDRNFEACKTFRTVFKTADDAVEYLEPNRWYLVP
jgi:murein DD-endopeptidase MepM/ murein hydrolase activator NlpD